MVVISSINIVFYKLYLNLEKCEYFSFKKLNCTATVAGRLWAGIRGFLKYALCTDVTMCSDLKHD